MNILNNQTFCYIVSIALQMSGALILMVAFWGNTRKIIIDTYFPKTETLIEDREDISITKKDVQGIAKNIYMNRIAFVYIFSGYLLGICGGLDSVDKSCIAAKIICWTIGWIIVGNIISNIIARIMFRKKIKVNYEEVKGRVAEAITEAEIDALFEEVFKS